MAFKQVETQELPDIQSVGTLYEHVETGARVLYLANDDSNKAFTIGFKTPPYNDNGIAHIIEHSVLNGSKKYPSKEPFVELIKGSLNTFVNAMTFSDKTIYPVASTNQKDFMHLMSVYLDAVFKPHFYDNAQILAQEGWHYHLESAEDELIYKGVVYNEMKGATASPERQVQQHLTRQLYPNSIYRHESGGDPKAIPSLTQVEFTAFHQQYYHPSNSLTVLYGDLDETEVFAALEEYFSSIEKQTETVDLSFEAVIPAEGVFEDTYSITAGDDPEGKDYLALGWHVAEPKDVLDLYGLEVMEEILLGNNQAPLKRALLDADIGGDIVGGVADFGYPTAFMITAKYSDASKMDRFKQIVQETLESLAAEGIDSELIDAALNKITFRTKEAAISEDNPRGVIYAINAYRSWLYGKSPYVNLQFSDYLKKLGELAGKGYFEQLIKEKLLNNSLQTAVILKAEPGKNDQLEAETHKRLQAYKASLSKEEVAEVVRQTQSLIERQETPDKPEELAKIPTLTKEDLSTHVEEYPLTETTFNKETIFYHAEQFTSGIDYISLYVDLKDATAEEYLWLSFLSRLVGKLATKKYDVATLQRQMDLYTGGIYGNIAIYEDQSGNLSPYFVLRGKALDSSLEELVLLMQEIMCHTQYEDDSEILKITQQLISQFERRINSGSHVLAANRALSQMKASAKLNEMVSGMDQFQFLKDIRTDLQSDQAGSVKHHITRILKRLLNKNRLNILYVGEQERGELVKEKLQTAFSDLSSAELSETAVITPGTKQNEAFIAAQDVNYVATASNASDKFDYNGASKVLATTIRYSYLWNEIRVKGGAYGSLYNHQRNGQFALSSYRDPNIRKTLDAYKGLPDYVSQMELSESELLKYIIGTISPMEQPKSAFSKGLAAFNRLKTGVTREELIHLKEEILTVDSKTLSRLYKSLERVLEESTVVVIGNKAQIESEHDLFDKVYELY
ncbi:insulinase family protein [Desemzia sp. RIT804]|uniref:insulinase family protein n=1 Tax=Desemzia sp. RIT 804 TaxID=2810209 RepID=UPI001950DAF4|nr:insulinase family protein [Desemzia sp. RIT 804]MBM6613780.1 insulinase family protein [Desemzia sp. RIT 804]